MKCTRAKLSERSSPQSRDHKADGSSPRHYCQRRLADSSHDEREWLKRYTPERFHLKIGDSDESEGDSRSVTPSSISEAPEIFEIKTPKNVFQPAFLTVTNIDLPPNISPTKETRAWLKRRVKFKTVPKHCSGHMHRMFVKNNLDAEEDSSRPSSRASTDYDRYAFDDYLCRLIMPDDSSEISLFGAESQTRFSRQEYYEDDSSNNNDSRFINKNNNIANLLRGSATRTSDSRCSKEAAFKPHDNQNEKCVLDAPKSVKTEPAKREKGGAYKKEKRKSITISRIPSPETEQVIRIDVISGYPVDSDSILSEATEDVINSERVSQLNVQSNTSQYENYKSDGNSIDFKYYSWKTAFSDVNTSRVNIRDPMTLLKCKTLNLSARK